MATLRRQPLASCRNGLVRFQLLLASRTAKRTLRSQTDAVPFSRLYPLRPPLKGPLLVPSYSAPGSMPFVLNRACADGPIKEAIRAFAAAASLVPAPMPAA